MFHSPFSLNKITIILLVIGILTLSACQNLPGKTNNAPQEVIQQDINDVEPSNNEYFEEEMIQQIAPESWTEPGNGPTVTPIVLGVEKRGNEGAIIERTPFAENSYSDYEPSVIQNSQNYETNTNSYVMPVSMADEMEIGYFNPANATVVLPGQSFHLDMTIKNTGTTTWQTSYKIVDISANPMAIQKEANLPYAVAPGGNVTLSIYMAAPSSLGNYVESFQIADSYGVVFGSFDYMLSVGDHSYITEIPTLTPSITPTYYSADGITATPDSLAWMCIDPERSKLQDCYSFCVEFSDRDEFRYCFYDGQRYMTPVP